MGTCHNTFVKPVEYTTPRVITNVNCELWVIVMCQCSFLNCKRCTTLVWNFDDGRDCVCVETGDRWEISESSTQFYCKPKTALSIFKKKRI